MHTMRNNVDFGNKLARRAGKQLAGLLPGDWDASVELAPDEGNRGYDALVRVRAPDGALGAILLQVKNRVEPRDAAKMSDRLAFRGHGKASSVVVAPFLSRLTRERLEEDGVGYADLTGNVRVALDRPALFVRTSGAERDPRREERPARTLKGAKAGRVVRALCDFAPPVGVRELAGRAGIDPGYASRVLASVRHDALLYLEEMLETAKRSGWEWVVEKE